METKSEIAATEKKKAVKKAKKQKVKPDNAAKTVQQKPQSKKEVDAIIVTSKSKLGFRRAGFRFSPAPLAITLATLTKAQIEALENEPELVCEFDTVEVVESEQPE